MSKKDQSVWMSLKEVTKHLECSKRIVPKMVAEGLIHRRDTSAHKKYLRSDVENLAAAQRVAL